MQYQYQMFLAQVAISKFLEIAYTIPIQVAS